MTELVNREVGQLDGGSQGHASLLRHGRGYGGKGVVGATGRLLGRMECVAAVPVDEDPQVNSQLDVISSCRIKQV